MHGLRHKGRNDARNRIGTQGYDSKALKESILKLKEDTLALQRKKNNGRKLHESFFNYEKQFEKVLSLIKTEYFSDLESLEVSSRMAKKA